MPAIRSTIERLDKPSSYATAKVRSRWMDAGLRQILTCNSRSAEGTVMMTSGALRLNLKIS